MIVVNESDWLTFSEADSAQAMQYEHSAFQITSWATQTVGTTPVKLVPTDSRRLAVQLTLCETDSSAKRVYVGYDNTVSSLKFVARLIPGGPAVELNVRSTVNVWLVASEAGATISCAEVI